ncbi:MAG: hypothetical protein NTZ84_03690 [Candidatus Nealsonbacteria bacterium]|nr:hypothetical protein [Candidatus Nealsonbacteria bacterium]
MSSFPNFTEKWNRKVKPLAKQVIEECKADVLVEYFVGQMIWGVEHDLADDRMPHLRLSPCVGTLNDKGYYEEIHKSTSPEEVKKLRKLGRLLEELQKLDCST